MIWVRMEVNCGQTMSCFLYGSSRKVMERSMKREKPDERKEESLITITEGNALNELDFVFIPSSLLVGIGKEA